MDGNWATEIIPGFLFLGNAQHAEDLDALRTHQVTHILNVAREVNVTYHETFTLKKVEYPGIFSKPAEIDQFFYDLSLWLYGLKISAASPRVLVHCRFGANRSVTVVIAALMKFNNWPLNQAYQYTKQLHPISAPFKNELISFEKKLFGKSSIVEW